MVVQPDGILYQKLKPDDIPFLVQEHFLKGQPVERLFYKEPASSVTGPHINDIPFYAKQQLIVLRNRGIIDAAPHQSRIQAASKIKANESRVGRKKKLKKREDI